MPLIRPSRDTDIPAIRDLYAHYVLHSAGTFETEPPSAVEMAARRAEVLARGLPWLVVEDGSGRIVGHAYCNWFKPRPAYRFSAEDSIYLAPGATGHGLGRALLAELAARAQRVGMRKLIAVIGGSDNAASIGAHHAVGFAPVGVIRDCGWKFGRWHDIVLMEKTLGAGSDQPPAAPARERAAAP